MIQTGRSKYRNLNNILISASAIRHNYRFLSSRKPKAAICPVLKSNAYGHGLTLTADLFDSLGAPFIFVDSLYEAYELYKQKIKTRILIMGYTHPDNLKVKKLPFAYSLFDLKTAKVLNRYQPGCPVHIFVDTGMHREGVPLSELPDFIDKLKKLKNLNIEGLMSHLATADDLSENQLFNSQIENYKKALEILHSKNIFPKWRHLGASSGRFRLNDPTFNLFRTGKSLYGISPLSDEIVKNLRPALKFTSTIVLTKEILKGATVGYGATFKAPHGMKIAIIGAGYYDGVDRRLSNKGFVEVNGAMCPIIGRASMNMTTIDITEVPDTQTGDTVIIFSDKPQNKNSISQAAKIAETIPYDLLVHLASTVKRTIVR